MGEPYAKKRRRGWRGVPDPNCQAKWQVFRINGNGNKRDQSEFVF